MPNREMSRGHTRCGGDSWPLTLAAPDAGAVESLDCFREGTSLIMPLDDMASSVVVESTDEHGRNNDQHENFEVFGEDPISPFPCFHAHVYQLTAFSPF